MKHFPLTRQLWPIVYEDDDLVAVVKPWGIDTGALAGNRIDGVVEILTRLRGRNETLVAANRLSRYESGVLLLGKNRAIVTHIRSGLRSQKIALEYVAIVLGRMVTRQITIGAPHGTSRGSRPKRATRTPVATKTGSDVEPTTVSALQHGTKRTLVSIRTVAPTTHALKAQLRAVRLRTLGDVIKNRTSRPVTHQMSCLHLARVTFHHPGLKRKVAIGCAPPEAFRSMVDGGRDVTRALFAALARRAILLEDRDVQACRLLTGAVEDLPGVVVDRFGGVVVIEMHDERDAAVFDLPEIARWYRDVLRVETVIARWNVKRAAGSTRNDPSPSGQVEHLVGRAIGDRITIRERGLRFLVQPEAGRSVGLYADHRDNRARVRAVASGKDVLNLFAYTCGFSLAAAVGGAATTVSVDLAGKHLEWGRENFALNDVDTEPHEFVQSDSFEYLRRAGRQERRFDLIIIDPPSFAHGRRRGQDFSVARDLTSLVAAALPVLRSGGTMMVSSNLRKMSLSGLRARVRAAAGDRRCRVIDTPPLPVDFAVDPDHAKTVFVEFS